MDRFSKAFSVAPTQSPEVAAVDTELSAAYESLARVIAAKTVASREQSVALTDLESSLSWARKVLVTE